MSWLRWDKKGYVETKKVFWRKNSGIQLFLLFLSLIKLTQKIWWQKNNKTIPFLRNSQMWHTWSHDILTKYSTDHTWKALHTMCYHWQKLSRNKVRKSTLQYHFFMCYNLVITCHKMTLGGSKNKYKYKITIFHQIYNKILLAHWLP